MSNEIGHLEARSQSLLQPLADAAAPNVNNGQESDLVTAVRHPHPTDTNRWADGTTKSGNKLRRTHGGRQRAPLQHPETSELFEGWAADLGELTAGERAVLRRAAEADAICTTAFDYLQRSRESWTSRRVQAALITVSTHAATVFRAASLLGLKRRAVSVPSLSEVMRDEDVTSGE